MLGSPTKMKILSVLTKLAWKTQIELCRRALFHMKTRVCLKYFGNHCLWKQFLDSNSPHTTSSLIRLTIFVKLKPFNLKLEQLICKKVPKFVLLDNYFPDLFTNLQIWYGKSFKFGLGSFFWKIKWFPAKIWLFSTMKAVNKNIKSKRKFFRKSCS